MCLVCAGLVFFFFLPPPPPCSRTNLGQTLTTWPPSGFLTPLRQHPPEGSLPLYPTVFSILLLFMFLWQRIPPPPPMFHFLPLSTRASVPPDSLTLSAPLFSRRPAITCVAISIRRGLQSFDLTPDADTNKGGFSFQHRVRSFSSRPSFVTSPSVLSLLYFPPPPFR